MLPNGDYPKFTVDPTYEVFTKAGISSGKYYAETIFGTVREKKGMKMYAEAQLILRCSFLFFLLVQALKPVLASDAD